MRTYLQVIGDRIQSFFPNKSPRQIFIRLCLLMVAILVAPIVLIVILVWAGFFGALPDKKELKSIQNPLASEVYSADSVLLGRYFIQERSYVDAKELPETVRKTLVATEDIRFYEHSGVDVKSLGRVFVKSLLLQKESSGGGSTLTQQLAKNLYPRKKYKVFSLLINKTKEILIALRLENIYTKDEILALYLNTIPFADNTFGIKTAADRFFSTPVKALTWDQSAVLIGMLKATHSYNPRIFPDRAMQRRNVVLGQLLKYEFIDDAEHYKLTKQPLALKYNATTHNEGLAPYLRAYLQQQLLNWRKTHQDANGDTYNLYTDGLKIYTSVDSRMQAYAEKAMKEQMAVLQKRFQGQTSKRQVEAIALLQLRSTSAYKSLKMNGLSEQAIVAKLKKPVRTRIFTWEGEKEVTMSPFDSIKHHIQFLQAGLMAIDPHNGHVKAWVGGIDHEYFKYDHVRESTKRQVGSTFKPIVYAAALERGVSPCTYISGRKTVYTNMDDWTPENTNEETYEKKYSMEGGLSESVNTVSVKLIEQTGITNAISTARKMGITSELPAVPSIALGTPSISVQEMVAAYAVFANGGNYVSPKYLLAITDKNGNVLEEFEVKAKPSRAISKETAQMMIHMLQSVVSSGTGSSLRSKYGLTNDIAGKTGTTQSNVDGWFVAVSPRLVTGAWVGADDPRMHFRSTALGQGAATALPIVARFFQHANADSELKPIMYSRFAPLAEHLADEMDCAPSKSGLNFFEKIFKKKKKVKVARFKGRKEKDPS